MPAAETLIIGALGLGAVYYAKQQVDATKESASPTPTSTVYNITISGDPSKVGTPDNPGPTDKGMVTAATPRQREYAANQPGGPLAEAGAATHFTNNAGNLAGFFNAVRPGVLRPTLGGGPLIGAVIGGGQAIVQGSYDLQARKLGLGPYSGLNDAAAITAATANVAAGSAVGAGSLGLATLDLNRGVTFFGLPIVSETYDAQGNRLHRSSFFGGLFSF